MMASGLLFQYSIYLVGFLSPKSATSFCIILYLTESDNIAKESFLCFERTYPRLIISLKKDLTRSIHFAKSEKYQGQNDFLELRKYRDIVSGYDIADVRQTDFMILRGIFILFFCEKHRR